MQYHPIIWGYLASACLCFFCMVYIARNMRVVAGRSAARVLFLMGAWATLSCAECLYVDIHMKALLTHVAYAAYAMMVPSWVLFITEYANRRAQTRSRLIGGLYALFSVFLLLQWINPGQLFYRSVEVVYRDDLAVFSAQYGPMFWAYSACAYLVILCMPFYLGRGALKGQFRRKHAIVLSVAIFSSILMNVPYLLKLIAFDITPIGFMVSVALLYLLYRDEFFADMPISRLDILDAMSDGIVLLNSNLSVAELNNAALDMLDLAHEENAALKATALLAQWPTHFAENAPARFVQAFEHPRLGQRYYRVSTNKLKTYAKGRLNYLLILQDETTLHNVQERVQFLERYDDATGLYNRQFFLQLLDQELERCQLFPQSVALVSASVINYRDYCYIYGNAFGNALIREVGARIKHALRKNDAISCFADDELFFYLRLENDLGAVSDHVDSAMKRIYDALGPAFTVSGTSIEVRMRMGVALSPQHALTSGKLIGMAHMARRSASLLMKCPYAIYRERSGISYSHSLEMERGLHKALERHELYLMYQPQVNIDDHSVVGVEALLRWSHPELGAISPVDFIPIAEENGLIHSIGLWVVSQVIAQMEKWRALGLTDLRVSANVSLSQLTSAAFSDQIIQMVDRARIDPTRLELEITESIALFPEALTHGHLKKLRDKGIRIAMDDFGMGHSSLTYIKQFGLDTIKVDRVLSTDLLSNQLSVAMVRSVSMLCQSIGADMIVEYIEQPEQLKILSELNCRIVQGYVFSPPLLVDACTTYILNANAPGATRA